MSGELPLPEGDIKQQSLGKLVDMLTNTLSARVSEIDRDVKKNKPKYSERLIIAQGESAQLSNLNHQLRTLVGSIKPIETLSLEEFDLENMVITLLPHMPVNPDDMVSQFYDGVRQGAQYLLDSLQIRDPKSPHQVLSPWKREYVEKFFPSENRDIDVEVGTLLAWQNTKIPGVSVELYFEPESDIPQRTLIIANTTSMT